MPSPPLIDDAQRAYAEIVGGEPAQAEKKMLAAAARA